MSGLIWFISVYIQVAGLVTPNSGRANIKFSRYQNSFLWLKDAGVALPVYNVDEPTVPLLLSSSRNLFKLFMSDIGLLASLYADGIQLKILDDEPSINFGSVYENAVAQEFCAKQ